MRKRGHRGTTRSEEGTERVFQGQVIMTGRGTVKQEGKGHNSSFTPTKMGLGG